MTFLVNDVLKHQAILLGNAEEQKKKKVISFNHSVIYSKKIRTCKNFEKSFVFFCFRFLFKF